jgi:hypothetical protein
MEASSTGSVECNYSMQYKSHTAKEDKEVTFAEMINDEIEGLSFLFNLLLLAS